ncbi:endogenous retrovirus group K member 113 Gag polyprotein-like, partial [Numida meleagris]|uniref:endogenous retrovirus group K member 113 Gag polyprotein-like n=1 Tax=Numida meleagris TaxID=8996 RepID=UPI000B3E2E04
VQIADWTKIADTLDEKGLSESVPEFLVVVTDDGVAQWVPLDPKGVARLVDAVEKKGLRLPLTLNTLEALTAPGPLLPHDIESPMRMVLEPVQYTLWKEEWSTQLKIVLAAAENDPAHPAFGSNLHRLMGTAAGMGGTPHGQLVLLRPDEVLVTSEAAVTAFRKFVRTAVPASLWSDIEQGPNESFQDFANRLIKAVEESDLPRAIHNPVIVDCLKQKSHENVRDLLCSAPGKLTTPGEIVKYVLDKQKPTPLTNEGLAAAIMTVRGPSRGPCYRYGEYAHIKAQCGTRKNDSVVCQLCGKKGHTARQCRKQRARNQGNEMGREPQARGPSHVSKNGPMTNSLSLSVPPLRFLKRPM